MCLPTPLYLAIHRRRLCKMNMTHDRPWTTNRRGHSYGVFSYGCAQVENQPPRLFAACVSMKLQFLVNGSIKMIERREERGKKILSSGTILAKTHMSMSMGHYIMDREGRTLSSWSRRLVTRNKRQHSSSAVSVDVAAGLPNVFFCPLLGSTYHCDEFISKSGVCSRNLQKNRFILCTQSALRLFLLLLLLLLLCRFFGCLNATHMVRLYQLSSL